MTEKHIFLKNSAHRRKINISFIFKIFTYLHVFPIFKANVNSLQTQPALMLGRPQTAAL